MEGIIIVTGHMIVLGRNYCAHFCKHWQKSWHLLVSNDRSDLRITHFLKIKERSLNRLKIDIERDRKKERERGRERGRQREIDR